MAVWLTLWTAAILVALWLLAAGALAGDLGAAPFLLIWIGFAGFGLHAGLRRMQALLGLIRDAEGSEGPAPRPGRVWRDGIGDRDRG